MERNPSHGCAIWVEKLMVREDTLTEEERDLLQDHMQGCAQCSQAHHDYQQLLLDMQSLQSALRPPDIRPQLKRERRHYFPGDPQSIEGEGIVIPLALPYTGSAPRPPYPPLVSRDSLAPLAFSTRNSSFFTSGRKRFALATVLIACLVAWFVGGAFLQGWLASSPVVQASSLQPQKLLSFAGESSWVHTVSWSPNGQYVASVWEDNTFEVWNAVTGKVVFTKTSGWGYALAWSPDSLRVAAVGEDDSVQIWSVPSGRLLTTYTGHSAPVNAVAWAPDGRHVASASDDGTVQIWSPDEDGSVPLLRYPGHNSSVNTVAWSPNGRLIASGDENDQVQVWNAQSGDLLFTYGGHHGAITSVSWSPDSSMLVSASYDGTAQVWNASTGTIISTYKGYHSLACPNNAQSQNVPIFSVAWSPQSRGGIYIASASFDGTVQVWVAKTGNFVAAYPDKTCAEYTNWIFTVAWSPDGTKLIAGGKGDVLSVMISGS